MKHRILCTLALLFTMMQAFAQSTTKYTYDNNNRLTKVIYGNGTTVTYTYDELGNRLSKTVSKADTVIKGDVNNDGIVSVADIVAVTNYMANPTGNLYPLERADVNNDGIVSVADIVAITNIMAGN